VFNFLPWLFNDEGECNHKLPGKTPVKRFLSHLFALFLGGFAFSQTQIAVPTTPQLTTLHGFTVDTDGSAPTVRLVADKAGALSHASSDCGRYLGIQRAV
jgi:hypothetical protein